MGLSLDNLVQQTSASTGTGNMVLAASAGGFQTFNAAFGNGATQNKFPYFISNQNSGVVEWEVGTGHMADAVTLVRDTVLRSSNADAAVNFSGGIKNVICDIPAENQVIRTGRIVAAGTTIDLTDDDEKLEINEPAGTPTVICHDDPTLWKEFFIKDKGGNAAVNPITITPDGVNFTTIDGQASLVIDENYGGYVIYCNGTEWSVK